MKHIESEQREKLQYAEPQLLIESIHCSIFTSGEHIMECEISDGDLYSWNIFFE